MVTNNLVNMHTCHAVRISWFDHETVFSYAPSGVVAALLCGFSSCSWIPLFQNKGDGVPDPLDGNDVMFYENNAT